MRGLLVIIGVLAVLESMGQPVTWCGEHVPIERAGVRKGLYKALKLRVQEMKDPRLQERAALYLPYIELVLLQYGFPTDLKYVAMCESRLLRNARSPVGAGGMWQFMPATAAGEGLMIGHGADERGRVIKSTHAAVMYLSKLHRQLGSWHLAAAANNLGIGRLQRMIIRQGTTDYYALRLNPETGNYLYNIVAFKLAYESTTGADTTPVKPLPALPSIKFGGDTGRYQMATPGEMVATIPDTTAVMATLIRDSKVSGGLLAFATIDTAIIGGHVLPRRAVVETHIFEASNGRVQAFGAGIDVAPGLQEYVIYVTSQEGRQGLPGDLGSLLPAGRRAQLLFIKQ